MKEKFTTVDLFAVLREMRERLLGMRVANVYDIDQKTYLIKLAKPDLKVMLLFESGVRMHTTDFEWPKSMQPSGFAMKLRKHLRTRRLTALTQLGVDRVVDMQFGSNEAAYHLIVEIYDRGNVILTDHTHTILSLLRTRTDVDSDVRFATREIFSQDTIKMDQPTPTLDGVREILTAAKPGDQLKHVLNPHFVYGSALLTHCLIGAGLKDTLKIEPGENVEKVLPQVMCALEEADLIFKTIRDQPGKGYLIQKREKRPLVDSEAAANEEDILTNVEFHPLLFRQHESLPHKELETFDRTVDEFFSSKSGQKQDLKALQVQKTAVKKLDNVRRDHERRIDALQKSQEENKYRAELIEMNLDLVERASLVIRSAVANAMDWGDIELLVKDAQSRGDPVAMAIQGLKLKTNEITLLLKDPSEGWDSDEAEETDQAAKKKQKKKGTKVDIDLGLSAYGNATRLFVSKKQAAKKEQKTVDASGKALKSAEKKTKQTLKEASAVAKILKARKVHWFEKFFWFISSENYLVIGGRDQQQNELLVKKYLKEGDVYVHADIHGATSVVIKNPSGDLVPPKTLNEAGHMAVCYSSAWDARIIISAWWVYHHQVSKTAPSGEYLTTGSFMIRGKKNFLPPCQLVLGFGFLFRVDDSCIPNHLHERKVKALDEDQLSVLSETVSELTLPDSLEEEVLDEEDEGNKGEEDESDVEEDSPWPDTTISVAHISGDKYELQRGVSVSSSHLDEPDHSLVAEERPPLDQEEVTRHQHMSAKQKREQRKQRQKGEISSDDTHTAARHDSGQRSKVKVQPPPPDPQQPAAKRGQKSKQKKIRNKYGDQDEEDRELMLKLLGSSGAQKPQKNKKSASKGKKKSAAFDEPSNPRHKYRHKDKGQPSMVEQPHRQTEPLLLTVDDGRGSGETANDQIETTPTTVETPPTESTETLKETKVNRDLVEPLNDSSEVKSKDIASRIVKEDEEQAIDKEERMFETGASSLEGPEEISGRHDDGQESDEEEKKAILVEENVLLLEEAEKEQLSVLDALTGCPVTEDVLLYAIPVCAPYSSLLNYKYKVKLVPGTNRRGKAAKAAVHRFTQNRECTQVERDLLKSVKDNDLSRYIPGKVKMTLPQATNKKR